MSRIGVAAFQASIVSPVCPMKPRPHTVLSAAVSIGMIMPCTLRKESSSMTATIKKASGRRTPISRACSTSVRRMTGSPAT